uniref:Glutamate rich 2 n=1 Tax=Molossus molossus TaxID=27622 RepID=A0A7J8FR45_MOLMO|nr:glutamate rich 2 [Molossus molossus]
MKSLQSRRKIMTIASRMLMISCPNQQMMMVKMTPMMKIMKTFLRAEMSRDYHLAKKLCQMILIYEPENPEAKEFFSLIEEMLLKEKARNLEDDDQESEEDSSRESEGESTEELSEESSDECEDG